MSRKAREVEAVRLRRQAEKEAALRASGMRKCAKCGEFTSRVVSWIDLSKEGMDRMQEFAACQLRCAIQIAGEDNFSRARWG
jgi:hypothetical protein